MDKLNARRLGVTYAGCFLGAGFVSGQELKQFFVAFGVSGYAGVALAVMLLCVFGLILFALARMTGLTGFDRAVIKRDIGWLRMLVGILETAYLFALIVIMAAGAGALANQIWGFDPLVGSGVLCALIMLVALKGYSGMIAAFSMIVPVLIGVTVIISGAALIKYGFPDILRAENANTNPMLANWVIAALTFVCYNLFGGIGILTPLGARIRSKRDSRLGLLLSGVLLIAFSLCIMTAMLSFPACMSEELPMLTLAYSVSDIAGYAYSALLFCGMFGAALSMLVAVMTFAEQKSEKLKSRKPYFLAALCVVAWGLSRFGFGNMIGAVLPVCGYVGIIMIVLICAHYVSERRRA